jgi:hypothetical protein
MAAASPVTASDEQWVPQNGEQAPSTPLFTTRSSASIVNERSIHWSSGKSLLKP